jgi:hypothetical protein
MDFRRAVPVQQCSRPCRHAIVQIIGSSDMLIDPFPSYADGFLATPGSGPVTTGDDVFIGQVTIDSSVGAGTFYSADFSFDSDQVTYLYLRVFDSFGPLTGSIDYGFSGLIGYTSFFGVAEVDFGSGIATTNNATFYIVPEPGSGSLLLVFMSLLFGVRYSMRSRKGVKVALPRNSSLVDDDENDWL